MKKKWLISIGFALAIALLTMPLSGLSSQAKGNDKVMPNQVDLGSGGIAVNFNDIPPVYQSMYHEPQDGIIMGGLCTPDQHEFDKNSEETTIVFTAGVSSKTLKDSELQNNVDVYVEITSNGQKVLELPFMALPEVDPNTGKPLWLAPVHFGAGQDQELPTGEYNYMFKAKEKGKNGHVLDVWVPKNHKFTITDN